VQFGLEVETIISSAYPGSGFGGRISTEQWFLTSAFSYKFSTDSYRNFRAWPQLVNSPMAPSRERYIPIKMTLHKLCGLTFLFFICFACNHTSNQSNSIEAIDTAKVDTTKTVNKFSK